MSDGEELIRVGAGALQGGPGPRGSRALGVLVAASLSILIGTGAFELFAPPKSMGLVGKEAREAREAAARRSLRDGSWARSIETEFRLRGRVRRAVGPYWSALMYRLGVPPSREVIIGKDGWLFLRSRVELDEERAAQGVAITAHLYAALDRRLGAMGTDLILLPLPRKAVVCDDQLPDGIDPRPALDRGIVERLRARGLHTVDVLPAWEALDDDQAYLPLDTHWARGARLATAKEVARQAPELATGTQRAWFEETDSKEVAFLLDHVGIFTGHPVRAHFARSEEKAVRLLPKRLRNRLRRQRESGDVVLVGSSFSDGFDFADLLVTVLQSDVVNESESGQPMFHSMARGLRRRGICRLPRTIVSEFPVDQVAGISPGNLGSTDPAAEMLLMLAPLQVFPVDAASLMAAVRHERAVDEPLLTFSRGSLLSSGDGTLSVELTIEADAPSRWSLVSDALHFPVDVPAGRHVRVIPVVQGTGLDEPLYLIPRDGAAASATVEARVVTEAPLVDAPEFSPGNVGERDLLCVTWSGKAPSLRVVAKGRDRQGAPRDAEWRFAHAGSRIAVMSLAVFEGGVLDTVSVDGPVGPVTIRRARSSH